MNKRIVLTYSIIHFFIDLSCATLVTSLISQQLYGTLTLFFAVIIYNFFAFAAQLPIGIIADKLNKNALCSAIGCMLVVLAYLVSKFEIISCIIAGLGNAMFHIGGGIDVLNISNKKATLSGIFVSTGAMGIFLGSKAVTMSFDKYYILIFVLILSTIALIKLYRKIQETVINKEMIIPILNIKEKNAVLCFIITVCIRSYVGLILTFEWKSNFVLALLFTCSIILGKMIGGIIGDKVGFTKTSIISLILAAICFTFAFDNSILGIIAVLLFNMTMPITLTSLSNIFENNKGMAFGLLTFALFLGAVPVFFGYSDMIFNPIGLFTITIISAIILYIGLTEYNTIMEKRI